MSYKQTIIIKTVCKIMIAALLGLLVYGTVSCTPANAKSYDHAAARARADTKWRVQTQRRSNNIHKCGRTECYETQTRITY